MKFEFFDVTADVGYKAYGETLGEAFENAALAMFEVITDTSTIKPLIEKKIKLDAEDEYAILYDWLSELLFFHDSEFMVFSNFNVKIECQTIDNNKRYYLEASAFGEQFDPSKHERRSEVKAVTYHMMDININCHPIKLQVILDI
jgi:SHS2 domain-containing protein